MNRFACLGCALVLGAALVGAGATAIAAPGQKAHHDEESRAMFTQKDLDAAVAAIVKAHPQADRAAAQRGVRQVSLFWRASDGDAAVLAAFAAEQFAADADARAVLLERFDAALEALGGHRVALTRTLRERMELDLGAQLPVDLLFATLDPFDHFVDDAFTTKVAFVALLNFELPTLPELKAAAAGLSRQQWAGARLAKAFSARVPGEVSQAITRALATADDYIANYNVHTAGLVDADGAQVFPGGPKLISHWGLRDHIKALYSDPVGNVDAQRLIKTVMERIVRQEIPAVVIDNPAVQWDPVANRVRSTEPSKAQPKAAREPDRRFQVLLDVFHAMKAADPHTPTLPTYVARRFDHYREMTWDDVDGLLSAVLKAPVAHDVAALISRRLGRPLEAFDIWYDGFKVRATLDEAELDRTVRGRYPTLEAFAADLPGVLVKLGFAPDKAAWLAERIAVDPARGAGHAMGAGMRTDKAHLRTRVPTGGMDYKGYNIALHELGHCVEQTFSVYAVDRVLMGDVPNVAFTEAFAFLFQVRDLDVLGLGRADPTVRALNALDAYWMTFEIAGVGLLDMRVWRWMYDHPNATAADLRDAVAALAIDVWNTYYAPVLKVKDTPLLAIYSHMINSALYLPDYTLGHLIQFQIERAIEGKNLATEMERMLAPGRVTPDAWMLNAVGAKVSAQPLIDAAAAALTRIP
jgi:hypothetical protein